MKAWANSSIVLDTVLYAFLLIGVGALRNDYRVVDEGGVTSDIYLY